MARLFALLSLATLLGGCSHYRLGTGSERDFETLFVAPVQTDSLVPQATAILSTQIREAFIRDGRLRVVNTPGEADAILTVRLTDYQREAQTRLPTDSGLSRTFGLSLQASATLAAPDEGKTWFADRPLVVERQIFTEDGAGAGSPAFLQPVQQTQAEYAILPVLGESLARQLTQAVLDTW